MKVNIQSNEELKEEGRRWGNSCLNCEFVGTFGIYDAYIHQDPDLQLILLQTKDLRLFQKHISRDGLYPGEDMELFREVHKKAIEKKIIVF